jgi:threonylcarbamoyladenosine tRNA methylthiotransferase MtaB
VDVIVGFPGETEEDFLETYRFVQALEVSYLHVFTYSERPNTPAFEMANAVPMQERRRRNEMLSILSEKKKRYFYEQHLGTSRKVLFEVHKEAYLMSGFTDNYIKVVLPIEQVALNTIASVELQHIDSEGIVSALSLVETVF